MPATARVADILQATLGPLGLSRMTSIMVS